jgi:formylglycine-generating enzyme required for sulfatase activity
MTIAEYKRQMRDINGQFKMGRTEVTVAMWKEYCAATNQSMPSRPFGEWIDNHPIVFVSWNDIMGTDGKGGYCAWASSVSGESLSLPTESQWEYAATRGDGRNYPWGGYGPSTDGGLTYPGWDSSKCVNWVRGDRTTAPVGSLPAGNSPFGCSDMAGNVREWCLDADTVNLDSKVFKGGSWGNEHPGLFWCALHGSCGPYNVGGDFGFRLSAGPK